MVQVSTDPEYEQLQTRYNEVLHDTNQLTKDVYTYKNAMKALLEGQTLMGRSFNEVFDPSGEKSTESTNETSSRSYANTGFYAEAMQQAQQELLPAIEILDNRVLQPLQEIQGIQKNISKTLGKRERKKLDFDRFSHAMQKLADMGDSQPTAVHKAQVQLQQATEEYASVDQMVKEELPRFFALQGMLMRLVLREIYVFQRSISETLFTRTVQIASTVLDQQQQKDVRKSYDETLTQLESLRVCDRNSSKKSSSSTVDVPGSKDPVEPNLAPCDANPFVTAAPRNSNTISLSGNEPADDTVDSDYAPSAPPLSEAPLPSTSPCSSPAYDGERHKES
ncbi:hypothetical protein BCR43DRAFT_36078 [Syncephalastrum racemosum]|uniref:BAR domain-containing protein n=1 Tax=Syncephalastrum racemosum TaxID=13706 RepID=A0A1X2HU46_SYNRA|nr:hypothetical protein BCR43DRAFT_36078 [Syncephalastrum racemosum]